MTVIAKKVKWGREAAGNRLVEIDLGMSVLVAEVTDNQQHTMKNIAPKYGLTPEQAPESPHFLIGSINWIMEELERRREKYGFSYLIFGRETHEALAPVVARLAGK